MSLNDHLCSQVVSISTNVARATRTVRPYGLDISSGIETNGVKDNEKMKAFTNIVRTIALS